MLKYRAYKDPTSGKWMVEKVETFFPIPLVVEECQSRSTAYAVIAKLREQQFAQQAGSATFADPRLIG